MKVKRYILLLILNVCALVGTRAYAQYDAQAATYPDSVAGAIRYVHPGGAYNNDGRSWGKATNRLQDAINSLRDYMNEKHLTSGSIYVAAGTYIPTESTEAMGGSMLNTSFKVYAGIKIYGGFNPDSLVAIAEETNPSLRKMVNGKTYGENWSRNATGTTSAAEIASQWDFQYKTILSGNHSGQDVTFVYDSIRGRYNTTFPANSYHVVWFATNGQYETTNDSIKGHFRPLAYPALVDGCVITSGNASTRSTSVREHTAYGGGAYLVGNSELRNCTIERCSATLRGGGAFLDGGGRLEFCYIHTCQSIGVGVLQGYGGGVCIEYDGSAEHCHITNCAARCGGGIIISHVPEEYPWQLRIDPSNRVLASDTAQISVYSPFATSCVVNNNMAAAEAGGIYLSNGGTVNHCTVTANCNIGPDVTYFGRRHGRSGGIYIRNCGMIFNSVFWGNRCDINNDVQFACVRQKVLDDYKIFAYHSAFMNHDISDWTGVEKEAVFSLEKSNLPVKGSSGNFPCFFKPTVNPNNWNDTLPGAGVFCGTFTPVRFDNGGTFVKDATWKVHPEYYPGPRIWHLSSYSALDQKGVQVTNAVQDASEWIRHAHTDYGVVSNPFEPVSTLGALVRKPDPMSYALVAQQGVEGRKGGDPIPTLFIDPNRKGEFDPDTDQFSSSDKEGNSWETPIRDLGEAIMFFRQYLVDDEGDNHHYMIPALDGTGHATGEPTRYDFVQILVKEGTITTAGPGNYLHSDIRTAAIRVESHMRLYGGYPSKLTGTDTSERNPHDYVSNITSNVTGIGGERGYENNSAHVIAMVNVEHAIVDGFTLSDANTHGVELTGSAKAGGGLLLNNGSTPQKNRIHMTGNQLRNCVITNCSSPKGAAVYVNGEYENQDGMICYAELKMVNCVIRNNTADYSEEGGKIIDHGVITANGRAYIEVEHCNIVNNVGYPFKADNKDTEDDSQVISSHHPSEASLVMHGYIRVNNSIVFCNGEVRLDDRGDLGTTAKVMSVFPDGQAYVFGEYNMFDEDLRLQKDSSTLCPRGFFDPAFVKSVSSDFVPEIPGNTTFGASLLAPLPSDKHNQAIFTRTDINATTYPGFVNPSRNVGNSISGDKPLYGGVVSYAPLSTNPCVNAADLEENYPWYENYDRTDNCVRDRGGSPDIGAIENTDLLEAGAVLYVTPKGRGKMDGSSWSNAIAGNLVYQVGGSYVVDPVNADSAGQYVTTKNHLYRDGYAVDYVYKTGSTTYIDRQTVTQKRINLTYKLDGSFTEEEGESTTLGQNENTQTITESNTLTRQKTEFIYGEKSGASRNFYRTNLKDSQIGTASQTNSGYSNADIDNALSITNNREEDYVSGLQFAVEKAALYNKDKAKENRIQVWVGNGTYEDYKGFVMRNKVEVFGGFPADKYSAPSQKERHALVSDAIPLSAQNEELENEKDQYETILQIIDKKPFDAETWAFDTSVMLYRDSDYTESGDKTITTTTAVTIPVYYRRDSLPEGGYSAYYEVPGDNVEADLTSRIINPSFEQNGGKATNWNNTKAKYGWPDVTGFSLGGADSHCARIANNENIDFYQDIENLEEGLYRVSVQGFNKGKAQNNVKLVANGEERVLISVASSGDDWSDYVNLLASGDYNNNWVDVYVGASGHLRIGLKGSYSGSGKTIFDNFKLERLSGGEDITSSTTTEKAAGYNDKKKSKGYSSFRKPVLYMPDVCLPTYWPGKQNGSDNISNERRQNITDGVVTPKAGTGYVQYEDVHWDGFTIQNGFVYDYYANRDGGGGVRMFEGATLEHCVVKDNTVNWGVRTRGGGGYCDGRTANVISCFFVNNLNSGIRNATPTSSNDLDSNGGGIYMLVGTCYNSLFANNVCWGKDARGAGIYIEQSTFYNNTVAYNTCRNRDKSYVDKNSGNKEIGHGVHQYEGSNGGAVLNVFNTIFYGNTGRAIGTQDNSKIKGFKNCYIQSTYSTNSTIINKMVDCIIYNNKTTDQAPNPFERGAEAPNENNYRLANASLCINAGAIPADFTGEFPNTDVDFADRIQDCQIDIGAYEYDGAKNIQPDTTTHPGKAIYYVCFDSPGGDASANSPANAACKAKLQKVLDAAGRYKFALMTQSRYFSVNSTPVADDPDSTWTVEVWLEGDSKNNTTSSEYGDWYTPTRSTKHSVANYQDNTLDYSFIVPHGIQVKGGYSGTFYHMDGTTVVDERDPLTYRSVLSGKITATTGAEGNCFHVVTFTDDLFTTKEKVNTTDGENLTFLSAKGNAEDHRAVLDGLFIEDGEANSPDPEDRIGGGAVVTGYAHIRNCVVQNNTAEDYGGGLYLQPMALISGTIIKNNEADKGGGMYIEAPVSESVDSLAHVFSTTICHNTANTNAGGMWFDNTNARVNSTVLWQNTANDFANVSGTFSRTSDETDYPFNFCAVESRRLEGQGNVELSPRDVEGVRWDAQDPFNTLLYYPIEMSSTLSRAGMTYRDWNNLLQIYTTLDSTDIAGVSRTRWSIPGVVRGYTWGTDTLVIKNNDFIEIGARAINKTYEINVDEHYVMRRLYVMHTELLNSVAARALQDNTANNDTANMYRQMGSCTLNPFHRLGDAFDYIIAARKKNPALYRNARFEVFVEKGTYYPYHNAYGIQDEVRMNTFLIPEATTVVGGINSQYPGHFYGQEGYIDKFTNTVIGDGNEVPISGTSYHIVYALSDSIRLRSQNHRPMRDYNLNSVIEPWELDRQTILSGNAVSGETFTHVYHVVTIHADSTKVGPQPFRFLNDVPEANWRNGEKVLINVIPMNDVANFKEECDQSRSARSIILDGLVITGGSANYLDPNDSARHAYQPKTYFRGGGIYVDGNWTKEFEFEDTDIPSVTDPAPYNIPLIVRNCQFTDNMAGNGGAIYSNGNLHVYSCHFTQNYSQGPMTKYDQQFIPWSAGGCIASNSYCGVVNTLFDNNEAKRGLYPITVTGKDSIPNADARQGFGGVLSIATEAKMRVANCHFMRNKAVAYSAIYNFTPNSDYSTADSMQLAFNSIFWGNEVHEVESLDALEYKERPSQAAIDTFNVKYKPSRKGVFHYDAAELEKYERLLEEYNNLYNEHVVSGDTFNVDVISKLTELRAQGNKMEGLYFCSYRKTYGPSPMKPNVEDGYLLTRTEQQNFTDPRQLAVPTKVEHSDDVEDYSDLFTYVYGNNNVLINRINTATDGPNFKQPSLVAGIDGYMQNADWLLARMNVTTDQGWGHLKQTAERKTSYFMRFTEKLYETQEAALAAALAYVQENIEASATVSDSIVYSAVIPRQATVSASFNSEQPKGPLYNFLANRTMQQFNDTASPYMPIADDAYMTYTRESVDTEMEGAMLRISTNPRLRVENVYIDLGVYEYQYVQLDLKGNEVDTMWVSTREKGMKHDGLTFNSPTTDLQAAIDLLMSSHNNHDKYICFLSDGEEHFAPSNILDNRRAFIISSNSLAPLLPDSAMSDYDYGVRSLTFLGGYNYSVQDAARDPEANPTIIEMPNTGNQSQLNQLFVVEDMTRQMLQANWMGEWISRDSVVIPIVFDGITFINPYSTMDPSVNESGSVGGEMNEKGGAAIYYRWQRRYVSESGSEVYNPNFNLVLHPDSALIDGEKVTMPKLTVSNCIFMDNGARTEDKNERSPAIRIDHGGGRSLIVNSLFHSNAGAPILALKRDTVQSEENDLSRAPNDVIIINSTFALNDGHLTLGSDNSEIHNSLIWLDDLINDTTTQLEIGDSIVHTRHVWDKNTNNTKVGIADRVTNNAFWGCFLNGDDDYHNENLSTENNSVFEGPYFASPDIAATTSDARRARSFRLKPAVRTMNVADTTVYRNRVFFRMYPDTAENTHNKYWRRSNGFKSISTVSLANDSDLAGKPRFFGTGMERGAYECMAVLQRVLYVQPTTPSSFAGDGSSWQSPFGQGQLQDAIDVAAVYTYLNRNADPETRKAYVFVKGSYQDETPTNIVARDGVSVFGSIPEGFRDTAWVDPDLHVYPNSECRRYVNYVRSIASGVGSPNATPTRLNSLTVKGDSDYSIGFLLDGFIFKNPGLRPDTALILLDDPLSAVRNCIIADNHVVNNNPVVDLRRGLLYNSLLYNDSANAIVKVGANGLLLNNTIVSPSTEIVTIDSTLASPNSIINNIEGLDTVLNCFAPYLAQKNAYTLPSSFVQNVVPQYQLHEHSVFINAGKEQALLPSAFSPYIADSTVCFGLDRDILGNPRRIDGTVDKGALETWRVEPGEAVEITALTNKLFGSSIQTATDHERRIAYTTHFGGNAYPHEGSVVYLMDSSAMSMQYNEADDFEEMTFSPGYMLLKSGASFYGNGHAVELTYLAAEKRFVNQRYSMTAFPYNYDTCHIISTTYYPAKDSLVQTRNAVPFKTYQYSGAARSAKDYVFQTDNSSLWLPVDTINRTATEGYLMDFTETVDTMLRFTAYGENLLDIIYEEEADESKWDKIVYLTQYDHRTPGTGSTLNFTRQEDMGWNMKGLPWLVSNYRTDTVLEGETYLRQMYIPHVFYQMDGAGEYVYLSSGDQIYTSRSWDDGAIMSMGNAFFTQTATQKEREALIFHLPYYDHNKKKDRPLIRMVSGRHQSDILTVMPDSTAGKNVQYSYGRDGIKWQANSQTAQVYLLDSKRLSKISLLGAAPTEVDIPLGVRVPEETELTFSLPEKEAFGDYSHVWLIDYALNRYTNMLNEDYTVSLEAGENNTRFAIRIGGFPKTDKNGRRQYYVFAMDGTLYVRGLVEGDKITVYSQAGQLVHTATASGSEFKMPLRYAAGYVVKVNDTAHKVVNL